MFTRWTRRSLIIEAYNRMQTRIMGEVDYAALARDLQARHPAFFGKAAVGVEVEDAGGICASRAADDAREGALAPARGEAAVAVRCFDPEERMRLYTSSRRPPKRTRSLSTARSKSENMKSGSQ